MGATDQEILGMESTDLIEYMGTDAEKWTRAFLLHTDLANAGPEFTATAHSWFANAIEWGRTAGFSSLYEELKHSAQNLGLEDTSEIYTPGQLLELAYKTIPEDHQCL